jgi:hypothetical protein
MSKPDTYNLNFVEGKIKEQHQWLMDEGYDYIYTVEGFHAFPNTAVGNVNVFTKGFFKSLSEPREKMHVLPLQLLALIPVHQRDNLYDNIQGRFYTYYVNAVDAFKQVRKLGFLHYAALHAYTDGKAIVTAQITTKGVYRVVSAVTWDGFR